LKTTESYLNQVYKTEDKFLHEINKIIFGWLPVVVPSVVVPSVVVPSVVVLSVVDPSVVVTSAVVSTAEVTPAFVEVAVAAENIQNIENCKR